MISCDQSDYLEIACLFRIPIALTLTDGSRVEGIALDTGYDRERQECLLLQQPTGESWLRFDSLLAMTALQDNPHFQHICFASQAP